MRRTLPALVACLGAAATVLLTAGPAQAQESTPSYDVTLTIGPDGVLHVVERITQDFGDTPRHGVERLIPTRSRYDDTYDRVQPIDHVRASATNAPDDVEVKRDGELTRIRVGDPDRTVTGRHDYTIEYDVSGALNAFPETAELYWNAIGDGWAQPIGSAHVTVHAPGAITRVLCFVGPRGSTTPCASAASNAGTAEFAQPAGLDYGSAFTVVVELPRGTVAVGEPILEERFSLRRAFSTGAPQLTLVVLVLLAGLGGLGRLLWLRGRDRRFVGQIPGLTPAGGADGEERPRPLTGTPLAGAVEFAPPDGIRPGQVGTLIDEVANPLDVTATIVDLAVRGYLRIEELPRAHRWSGRDWRLHQLKPADDTLLPYERVLHEALFAGRTKVDVSDLKNTFYAELKRVQDRLYDDVVAQGWYRRRPDSTRSGWRAAGIGLTLAGAGLTFVLARSTHFGLVGAALVAVGLAALATARLAPARTGRGSAALARVLGFRQYVATAEAGQLSFEEATDVFSRYLPYAVVFGLTDRWAKAFGDIAAAQSSGGLGWYTGPPGWTPLHFGSSFGGFTSSVASTVVSQPSGSGGSGFSGGGFSGGGGGGGGGGSW